MLLLKVVCAPDLQHIQFSRRGDTTFDPHKEVSSWLQNGEPDAVLLLLRCDQRLTEYESDGYRVRINLIRIHSCDRSCFHTLFKRVGYYTVNIVVCSIHSPL